MHVFTSLINPHCRHRNLYSFELRPGVSWNYHCDECDGHWYFTHPITASQLFLAQQRAIVRHEREVGEYWDTGRAISSREYELNWQNPVVQRNIVYADRNISIASWLSHRDRSS